MTVETVLRMLLDMDAQCLTGRPSACGLAAEVVAQLAGHAEGSLRDPAAFGDWRAVHLKQVRMSPFELSRYLRGKP